MDGLKAPPKPVPAGIRVLKENGEVSKGMREETYLEAFVDSPFFKRITQGLIILGFLLMLFLCFHALANAGDRVDGSKTVTTAGTAERLAPAETFACWVVVQAKFGNTDSIFKGASTIDSTRGSVLTPGASVSEGSLRGCTKPDRVNLGTIWIDSAVSGEGVTFEYMSYP